VDFNASEVISGEIKRVHNTLPGDITMTHNDKLKVATFNVSRLVTTWMKPQPSRNGEKNNDDFMLISRRQKAAAHLQLQNTGG
jgi:hypothetical protein